jgi:adenylate kinase
VNLVLFGPPGAGKGTQAEILVANRGLTQLSTGNMLRAAIAAKTELGVKVEAILAKGDLVADDIVIGIIADRYDQPDCAKGVVFDGFPRTIAQAEALDSMLAERGKKIDKVIELKVEEIALLKRAEGRALEAKAAGKAPRDDDNPETVKNRLGVYWKNTAPLLAYYGKQGKVVTVDGMAPIAQVTKAIAAALDEHSKQGRPSP